ncbi:DNA-binding protein [Cupriavidus sp. SHE]|jgi:DNA-binding protein H-NS|uniref:H-NS histone family protein n=1 Tax=Cupriavidus metallidurans TaxID=119219 RepID=A0A482IS75_9BURK|nr:MULTISPECIES: H-NS histone family protein [Cupriavidus]KWR78156.1 DNA-binding protein [Cupriavidus sp. SHE]QBP09914.1 H-NS histone family protein [Cupriavidus metallidurans]
MATYKELLAEKAVLESKLEEMREVERGAAVDRIQQLMSEYGLTVDDIVGKRRRGRPAGSKKSAVAKEKSSLPPKYMNPKTGATWSGRGRAPSWLGKNRTRFLIAEA